MSQLTFTDTYVDAEPESHESIPTTLSDIPEEVMRLILAHIPLIDKIRYERICHLWKNVIYDMQYKLRFTKYKRFTNYCGHHRHYTGNDWIPQLIFDSEKHHQSPINLSILECVLKKCGKTLIAINLDAALIDERIFEMLGLYCPHVKCLSLSSSIGITDECLKIIAANYGKQLKHINLECGANRRIYFSTSGLKLFLESCPNIEVFHVASIRSQFSYRLSGKHLNLLGNVSSLSAYLPDVPMEELMIYAETHGPKLKRLNIDGIIYSETTVKDLVLMISLMPNLESLTLLTRCDIPLDSQIIALAKALPKLKTLKIRFNYITITTIESISYFQNLTQLEMGLWKPFETGLTSLSLESLQYCPKLRSLEIHNFIDGDSLFINLNVYCPNLEEVMLNNVFGCTDEAMEYFSNCRKLRILRIMGIRIWIFNIAPEITESGVTKMVNLCENIKFIEIPCTFNIHADGILVSKLIDAAKRRPHEEITFVYGRISVPHNLETSDLPSNLRLISKLE